MLRDLRQNGAPRTKAATPQPSRFRVIRFTGILRDNAREAISPVLERGRGEAIERRFQRPLAAALQFSCERTGDRPCFLFQVRVVSIKLRPQRDSAVRPSADEFVWVRDRRGENKATCRFFAIPRDLPVKELFPLLVPDRERNARKCRLFSSSHPLVGKHGVPEGLKLGTQSVGQFISNATHRKFAAPGSHDLQIVLTPAPSRSIPRIAQRFQLGQPHRIVGG